MIAIATFVTALASLIGAAGAWRRTASNSSKIDEVQVTVNGVKEKQRKRIEQLSRHLADNNIPIPSSPNGDD